jgi:hypothetical protein
MAPSTGRAGAASKGCAGPPPPPQCRVMKQHYSIIWVHLDRSSHSRFMIVETLESINSQILGQIFKKSYIASKKIQKI